jgi:hypothetical protein
VPWTSPNEIRTPVPKSTPARSPQELALGVAGGTLVIGSVGYADAGDALCRTGALRRPSASAQDCSSEFMGVPWPDPAARQPLCLSPASRPWRTMDSATTSRRISSEVKPLIRCRESRPRVIQREHYARVSRCSSATSSKGGYVSWSYLSQLSRPLTLRSTEVPEIKLGKSHPLLTNITVRAMLSSYRGALRVRAINYRRSV